MPGADKKKKARTSKIDKEALIYETVEQLVATSTTWAVLLEEAGRAALPLPLAETALAALTLDDRGSDAQRERWLPAIASGAAVATVALPGRPLVACGADADLLILAAPDGLHAVERGCWTSVAQPAFDRSRRLSSVTADTGPDTLLPGAGPVRRLLDRAAELTAPDGVLAYATCSLLRDENEDRVAAFLARHPGWSCLFSRRIGLEEGGDGFFTAHLTRVSAHS